MTERVVTAREPLSFEEALDTLKRAKDLFFMFYAWVVLSLDYVKLSNL